MEADSKICQKFGNVYQYPLQRFTNYVSNIFIFGKVIQFASHPCHCNSLLEYPWHKLKMKISC